MITNYYTLRLIALDLKRRFAGALLSEIFTQHREELVIGCTGKGAEGHIIVSCETGKNFILSRDEFPRAKKNSIDLFPKITGTHISDILMHPSDRQIIIHSDSNQRLIVQLFGSRANVLLVDATHTIRGAFLKPKEAVGKMYTDAAPSQAVQNVEQLHERLGSGSDLLPAGLKRCFPLFGPEVFAELLFRGGLEPEKQSAQLTDSEVKRLFDVSRQLQTELVEHPSPRIYFEGVRARTFSIIDLQHLRGLRPEGFDSVDSAIRTFLGASKSQTGFEEEYKRLAGFLQQTLAKAERTLKKIADEEESLARAASHELTGKVLTAHLHSLGKGMSRVELEDPFSPGRGLLTIALDPALTPAKNADRHFQKAKKIRTAIQQHTERKEELQQTIAIARELRERLESVDEKGIYREFLVTHGEKLREFGFKIDSPTKAKQPEMVPFRVFTVAGGFQVWAGKSSENNDLLTMKHARPNDLWFHARGSSGSHVVLKIGTGKGEPSKLAIQQAAGIAAYYSKMKNSKLVPVAMTERKYVRKPRGVPAGTVTLEREKTIFAEPILPKS